MFEDNHKYFAPEDTPKSVHSFYDKLSSYGILRRYEITISDGCNMVANVDNLDWFVKFMSVKYPKMKLIFMSDKQSNGFTRKLRRVLSEGRTPRLSTVQFFLHDTNEEKYKFMKYDVKISKGKISFSDNKNIKTFKVPVRAL